MTDKSFTLPLELVGIVDIKQSAREVEALETFMQQAAIREPGTQPRLPRTTRTLEELAKSNGLNLLIAEQRQSVKAFLDYIAKEAPHVQISFAYDPSAQFVSKIVAWFRQEVHPYTLVQIGLQPSIGAGCVLRTPNKYFDLSLRKNFQAKRPLLIQSLAALAEAPQETSG